MCYYVKIILSKLESLKLRDTATCLFYYHYYYYYFAIRRYCICECCLKKNLCQVFSGSSYLPVFVQRVCINLWKGQCSRGYPVTHTHVLYGLANGSELFLAL